jgi:hypothetical protein
MGKRVTRLHNGLLALLLAVASGAGNISLLSGNAFALSGAGTEGSPYLVSSCAQFASIHDDLAAHYMLTQDLNCISSGNSILIADGFTGTLDGDGNTLTIALSASTDGSTLSLFNTLSGATIKNLQLAGTVTNTAENPNDTAALADYGWTTTLSNIHSTVNVTSNGTTAGLMASFPDGSISGSSVNATVISTGGSGGTGGLFGWAGCEATITDTSFSGTISAQHDQVGGITGQDGCEGPGSTYTNVSATGTINAHGASSVGGIIGASWQSSLTNATANVAITNAGDNVGGLIGSTDYSTSIWNSSATGTVQLTGNYGGGLVGSASDGTTISGSFASGNVTGSAASNHVGGLVGELNGAFANSYARGSVTGNNDVGALVGNQTGGYVQYVYATGHVTGNGESVGGLYGDISNTMSADAFYDSDTTGMNSSAFGTGKSTSAMKNIVTYTDTDTIGLDGSAWDFTGTQNDDEGTDDIWSIDSTHNSGYPCLVWSTVCTTNAPADNDNVSDTVENSAPNAGDGNNDGVQDAEQSNVTSLVSPVDNKYVTLAVDSSCNLSNVSITDEASHSVQDNGYQYAGGFLNFTATGCAGNQAHVTLYYSGVSPSNVAVRKYNPATNSYFTVTSATVTALSAPLSGAKVTYTITDNDSLDTDNTIGTIVDPVGLGTLASVSNVGAPDTGIGFLDSHATSSMLIAGFTALVLIGVPVGILTLRRR